MHWENYISIFLQIEWDIIVVTVFLSILRVSRTICKQSRLRFRQQTWNLIHLFTISDLFGIRNFEAHSYGSLHFWEGRRSLEHFVLQVKRDCGYNFAFALKHLTEFPLVVIVVLNIIQITLCKYVSKFLLSKSHICEYEIYCSISKWWHLITHIE